MNSANIGTLVYNFNNVFDVAQNIYAFASNVLKSKDNLDTKFSDCINEYIRISNAFLSEIDTGVISLEQKNALNVLMTTAINTLTAYVFNDERLRNKYTDQLLALKNLLNRC